MEQERATMRWAGKVAGAMVASLLALPAAAQPVILMSKGEPAAALTPGSGYIESPQTVSADGRWVVFTSAGANLVPLQVDGNGGDDVFLFDRVTKNRFLVSHVPANEAQAGNGESSSPRISADGNWVVFKSDADDLAPADSNGAADVFLYERATGNVILVSHQDGSGSTANGSSGDLDDVQVAADGSFVTYTSDADDLVPGQIDTNGLSDVFLYDRGSDKNFLVSHTAASLVTAGAGRSESPSLGSGVDGVFVAYQSTTDDLVPGQVDDAGSGDIFLYAHDTQTNVLVSGRFGSATQAAGQTSGSSRAPVINSRGGFVYFLTFANDLLNGVTDAGFDEDVYGYDRGPGTLILVSHAAGALLEAGNTESSDFLFPLSTNEAGDLLAYVSQATNLAAGQVDTNGGRDVFLWDLGTNASVLVSHRQGAPSQTANGESYGPALTADGSHVGFVSAGTNLVSGQLDTNGNQDAFLFAVATGQSTLVSHQFGLPTTAVTSGGGPEYVAVNGNGDYVAHYSDAGDVVAIDGNADFDVFLFSRAGATNEAASLQASAGTAGANGSSQISNPPRNGISADGRYVVFTSEASNLVPGQIDNNGAAGRDVFLYDRLTDSVRMVSHKQGSPEQTANGGCQQPVISADGNFVAFACSATDLVFPQSDTNGSEMDVFVWNRGTDTNQLVSFRVGAPSTTGSGASERPSINDDGSLVAYQSRATDLVSTNPAHDANASTDVFLWNRLPNVNQLVSHVLFLAPTDLLLTANFASSEPVVSGRPGTQAKVAYTSLASNLLPTPETGTPDPDVFVYDVGPLTSALVSRNAGGQPANGASSAPSISDDGNWIAFHSRATDLGFSDPNGTRLDVVLHDRVAFVNRLVSHLPTSDVTTAGTSLNDSQNPQVSGDGTRVTYESTAPNLVAESDLNNASDVFLYDRNQAVVALRNRLVSKAAGLPQTANGPSTFPQVSTDGARVAFQSGARNLAPGQIDPNGATLDVFVWDAGSGASTVASRQRGTAATTGNGIADVPILSGNGRFVAFRSLAANLVPADQNALDDAFLFELAPADLQIVKTAGGPAVPGAPFQYLINVRNLGPEPVTGAVVTDVLPPNLLSASWSCVATGGSCTASGVGDINDVVNLPAGASLDYTVSGTLALVPSGGSMSNTARVDGPLGISDPDPANNESTVVVTLAPNAVLELTHLDSPDPVFVGTNLAYSTTIRNAGPSIAEKVSLSIALPTGVTFLSVSHLGCTETALVVSCPNLGDLLPGQVVTISTVVTAPGTAGPIMSQATADSDTSVPVGPVQTFTDVVDAGSSFIEFFTTTSTNNLNTLEWRTPFTGYDHTIIRFRIGSCPTSHTDGSGVAIAPDPGPGNYGRVDHLATNDVDYCYAAFVARDAGAAVVSIGKLAKGRPFDNSGKVKYAFSTGATAVTPPGLGGSGVYVPSNDRALYAISRGLGAGAGLWVPGYVPLAFNQPLQTRPPVVPIAFGGAANVAYVGSQDGAAHAVDAARGDLDPANPLLGTLWTKGLSPLQAAPAGWFAAFGGDDDRVLIGTRMAGADNTFYALIATSGTQFTPAGAFDNGGAGSGIGIISGGASVDYTNKRVYFASRARTGGSPSTLWCLPFDTTGFGPPCWDHALGNIDNGPVVRSGRIYVGTVAGEVIGRDSVDGSSNSWSFGTGAAVRSYVVLDRTNLDLYVTAGNTVWALTDGAGAERWKVTTIPNPSIPLFTRIGPNAYVFVGGGDGKLHQIDAATGGSIQSVTLGSGGSVVGSPTYDVANGLIYVGTDEGTVYAVAVPLP